MGSPKKFKTCVTLLIFSLLGWSAYASENKELDIFSLTLSELLEVTVEARKKEENLQQTPISLSVM